MSEGKVIEKVIFIAPSKPSFVQTDIEILNQKYNVVENVYDWPRKLLNPFFFVGQFIFLSANILSTKAIFCSFGGYWSILPSIFGKLFAVPSYVIVQGTDSCAIPAIDYGVLRRRLARHSCAIPYYLSTRILPVSSSLIWSENEYCSDVVGTQGVKFHFPNLPTPFTTIPYGFANDFWIPDSSIERDIDFITVMAKGQFKRRDGGMILQMAEYFSKKQFVIVGDIPLPESLPHNVRLVDLVPPNELRGLFQRSAFFVQLSLYEGFGCALAESMLCGCVPIVSAVNEMPHIVGRSGFVLRKRSFQELQKLTSEALENINLSQLSVDVRNRIIEKYQITARQKAFETLIEDPY